MMKIVVPVNNNAKDARINESLGRAAYFLLYDTNTNTREFIVNDAAASQGGTGVKAAQIIIDCQADAVLTPRCGQNAAKVLKTADIAIYKTIGDSIEKNITLFKNNQLSIMNDFHEGFHGGK